MKTIATHNGKFHADDVFAVATLQLLLEGEEIKVIRTRDEEEIEKADFVVDVGGAYNAGSQRFDHHQPEGAGKRENGIPYAAFGLVWKEYGVQIAEDVDIAHVLDRKLVQSVDAIDNGIDICEPKVDSIEFYNIGMFIDVFMPSWKEGAEENINTAFKEAVLFAKKLLEKEVERIKNAKEGYEMARMAYEATDDKRIVILNAPHPWKEELLKYPEPLFVIFPMEAGNRWAVQGVPIESHSFERRQWLPIEWRGKKKEELQRTTGVEDATFVHKDGFIGGAESKEGALALAKKALENNNE